MNDQLCSDRYFFLTGYNEVVCWMYIAGGAVGNLSSGGGLVRHFSVSDFIQPGLSVEVRLTRKL